MMKIKEIQVNAHFRYLWLKDIKDVDLTQHCAKCLIGNYDSRINSKLVHIENIELPEKIYYLCGVSAPYVWENNFHLAFKEKQGSEIYVERNGVKVCIENAEEIKFSIKDVNNLLPESSKKAFFTCRNWQFANKFKNELKASI